MDEFANFPLQVKAGSEETLLMGILASLASLGMDKEKPAQDILLSNFTPAAVSQGTGISAETLLEVSREIGKANQPVFVFGSGSAEALIALASLAKVAGAQALLTPKAQANSLAAYAFGLSGSFKPAGFSSAYVALGDELPSETLVKELAQVPFLAVQAAYVSPVTDKADVVLPVVAWMEQEGHYMNMEGKLQEARPAIQAPAEVWSNKAVLDELAKCLGVKNDGNWKETLSQRFPASLARV
jgi:anaerobic selenocysteine-containing dehydrogenase